jgi:hypothetical protein
MPRGKMGYLGGSAWIIKKDKITPKIIIILENIDFTLILWGT